MPSCGCTCKNETRTVDSEYPDLPAETGRWPCCGNSIGSEGIGGGLPCGYAVLFQCGHVWPWQANGNWWWGAFKWCSAGAAPQMTYPIHFLGKTCTHGCTYKAYDGTDNSAPCVGGASYTSDFYRICELQNRAGTNTFPPTDLVDGAMVYRRLQVNIRYKDILRRKYGLSGDSCDPDDEWGQYSDSAGCPCCRWFLIDTLGGSNNGVGEVGFDANGGFSSTWQLDVVQAGGSTLVFTPTAGSAFTTQTYEELSDTVPGRDGVPSSPSYVCDAEWLPFDRNEMVLSNADEWPSLPKKVCVVPCEWPYMDHRCDDHASFCKCCEAQGCDTPTLQGAHCDDDPTDLTYVGHSRDEGWTHPTGVTDPGGPCGYYWFTFSDDHLCDGFDHYGIQTWCDGSTWQAKQWCHETGGGYTNGTAITVSNIECGCRGATFDLTLPESECVCCEDEECCCPEDDVTVEVFIDGVSNATFTGSAASCVFTFGGSGDVGEGSIQCLDGGNWLLNIGLVSPYSCNAVDLLASTQVCEPFMLEFEFECIDEMLVSHTVTATVTL